MKVLLLNPPAKELVMRDYYCSETSKANYYWPPIDLLVLSGIMNREHDLKVLDANALRIGFNESLKKIKKIEPDVVISLIGSVSIENDMFFLKKVKEENKCLIFVIGDVAYFEPRMLLTMFSHIDGIIFDFASREILKYLKGRSTGLKDMAYRDNEKIVICKKNKDRKITYPTPKHELFPLKSYTLPFALYSPITTIIAHTYGCPFKCLYCPSGMLYLRKRSVKEFIEELKYVRSLGIKEVFFRDFTFNTSSADVETVCNEILDNNIKIFWSCEARVDNIDEELLKLMKSAGCSTIMFGVETYSDRIQRDTGKYITREKIIETFKSCKKLGISTLAHFIFGLPGDTKKNIEKTIRFSKLIGCDYAAFNLFVPRVGSVLRQKFILEGKIMQENLRNLDCSKGDASRRELLILYKNALKVFYL